MDFKRIDCSEARAMLAEYGVDRVQIVDVRDEESYSQGHIDSAVHLQGGNLQDFVASADLEEPLLVYCYHGHMSQSAAAYLAQQGFVQAFSLDGGYEAWNQDS